MFSATFPSTVQRLARQFLDEPDFLSLSHDSVHVASTEHIFYAVPGMEKDRTLVRVIELENPDSALIFCNTKMIVNFVTRVLQRLGYDADQLTSDLAQNKREKVLERVKAGRLRILVATDVAARGIDIINLSHVFQYDVPEDTESYIHRAGRTGRAGASGVAITLAGKHERAAINRIVKIYKIEMEERPIPTDEDVETIVAQRLTALLEAQLRDLDSQEAQRMERLMPLARKLCENEDSLVLAAMLLDDSYHNSLHAPPTSDGKADAERRQSKDRKEEGSEEKRPSEVGEPEREIDAQRVIERLENKRLGRDRLQAERMKRFIPLAQDFSQSEDELALIAMLLDEFERQPVEKPPKRSHSPRADRGAKSGGQQSRGRRRGANEPRRRRR